MNRVVRIVAKPNDTEWEGYDLVLDVMVNSEDMVVPGRPYFGVQGSMANPEPFVFTSKGQIDFGAEYDDPDRTADTTLLSKKIGFGECFTVKQHNTSSYRRENVLYTIKKIEPMR